jgi:hypothetical protein
MVSANDLNNADDATQNKSATSEDVFDFPEDHVLHQPEDKGSYWRYEDNQTTLTYWMDLDAWDIHSQGNASINGEMSRKYSWTLMMMRGQRWIIC